MTTPKTIGQMNGMWGIGLKLLLATYPVVIGLFVAWSIWVTTEQFEDRAFRKYGPRFTLEQHMDFVKVNEAALDRIREEIRALPSTDWRVKWQQVEEIARENRSSLIRIETKLGTDQ